MSEVPSSGLGDPTAPSTSLLLVDDDHGVRAGLHRALSYEGFQVLLAAGGVEALERLRERQVDLLLLDVRMPHPDGLEVCRRLRDTGDRTPVLMLTAADTVGDRVAGLEAGADDYLVKPFAVEELLARIRALLRRRPGWEARVLRVGDLTLDRNTFEVWRGQRPVELTRREFELLEVFMRHPNQVLSRERLLRLVWSYDFPTGTNVVEVYISYLRRKLEGRGERRLLHNVRGVGYLLRHAQASVGHEAGSR
jgi:two-component system, OmpR family, response regulator MprA